MTENYLPTKESIGYKNIKYILYKVFLINLDSISIREGEDENFAFDFTYGNIEIMLCSVLPEGLDNLMLEKEV
ncbi:hypothetical protein [Streptococcus equi]|uniref:hypothetical protein n=1 Tax=Streptococcus equi TaxID=1336 RepID=UPI001D18F410|nr:hypothetical protein [Streptococcus equi]